MWQYTLFREGLRQSRSFYFRIQDSNFTTLCNLLYLRLSTINDFIDFFLVNWRLIKDIYRIYSNIIAGDDYYFLFALKEGDYSKGVGGAELVVT